MSATAVPRPSTEAPLEEAESAATVSRTALSPAATGALEMIPLVVAYSPFALIIGAAIAACPNPWAGWSGSWLIYGGSAHLAALRTLAGAGPAAAVLTGLLINARLVVYSAGLARVWPLQPRWFRFAAAGLIIDPTYAAAQRFAARCDVPAQQRRHFFGAALTMGVGWSAVMASGVVVGSRLDAVRLEIVVPLCLLALVGTGLRAPGARVVVIVAAVAAVLLRSLPAGTGLLTAIALGVGSGLLRDRIER
jgi:predicted branched-subunit amino acid permease